MALSLPPALTRLLAAQPSLMREADAGSEPVLAVTGPPSLALAAWQLLTADGDSSVVRRVGVHELGGAELDDADAVLYVVRDALTPTDERALARVDRQGTPIVCMLVEPEDAERRILPYVPATDVVRAPEITSHAVDRVARRLAARVPHAAARLAGRLPALRAGVSDGLVRRHARAGASIGAAVNAPGEDLPALALNEIRMTIGLAQAGGRSPRQGQAIGLVAGVGGGMALRGLARVLRRAGLPAVVVHALVAYAGTLALGRIVAGRSR